VFNRFHRQTLYYVSQALSLQVLNAQAAPSVATSVMATDQTMLRARVMATSSGKRGRGKIVNISGGGATSPRPGFSAYAAAKTALVRFSETLAHEVAERSIDVNSIAPGVLNSRLTRAVLDAGPDRVGRHEYEAAENTARGPIDGRERAAELCTFLASAASDGITGKLISAQWDPWPSLAEHRTDLNGSDVYTLRRVLPRDRGFTWDTT